MFGNWVFLAGVGATIALVICLAAVPLAKRLGLSADTDAAQDGAPASMAMAGMAKIGGFAVALPALAAMAFLFSRTQDSFYAGLGLATFSFLILGYADDRQTLVPAYRLIATLAISAMAIYYAPGLEVSFLHFSFLSKSLFLDQWAPVFTVLAIVGLQNSVSGMGDRKGLLPAIMLFWLALLFYYSTFHLYPLLSAIAGALAVTLAFSYRGSVSLGSAGKYSLSVLLGCIAVYAYNQGFLMVNGDVLALMFLVPVLDFARTAISRVLDGNSPFVTDRRNFLHLLSEAYGQDRALVIYFAFVAIPNIMALLLPAFAALFLLVVGLVYAVAYTLLHRRSEGHTLA